MLTDMFNDLGDKVYVAAILESTYIIHTHSDYTTCEFSKQRCMVFLIIINISGLLQQ